MNARLASAISRLQQRQSVTAKLVRRFGSTTEQHQRTLPLQRRFFSSPVAQESSVEATKGRTSGLEVMRHGPSDGVVVLNVGGKDFMTLRSTVAANPVLSNHVARAEANQEFTSNGKAVFIDRDPTHFGIILAHLRNKVEGLSFHRGKKARYIHKTTKYVQLPKDTDKLRDLYVEATHFEIYELQAALCEQSLLVNIASAMSGGNPFDAASGFMRTVRRGAAALGGATSLFVAGTQPEWLALPSLTDKPKAT